MTISNNPFECGQKLKTGFDYFAKGFSKNELVDVFYHLISDRRQGQLLVESAEFCDVDTMYNPGEEIDDSSDRLSTSEVMILEAVRVRQFAQTSKTMAALQRVLNKKLESLGDITAGEAIIGKPKKTGLFASVTVQFPLSDGQTLSIIFHSPEGNKMKITASDEILAFRWLLNKRDITVAVAPDSAEEGNLPGLPAAGKDVSLEDVGMRCAQLISKNSARFAAKSAELVAAKKLKEELSAQADQLQASNGQLQQDLTVKVYEDEQAAAQINATQKQLENQINFNAELRAKLEGLKATGAGNTGKADGEDTTGGVDKEAADAALFEEKKAAFEEELTGRGFVPYADDVYSIAAGTETIKAKFSSYTNIGYGVVVGTDTDAPKLVPSKTLAGLDKQIAKALAWIDKKLADMKKAEADAQSKAITEREQQQAARNAEVQEETRLREVGKTAVPGVRMGDQREAGFMYELLQKGEVSQAEWDTYVEDLYASNKATKPEPAPDDTNPEVTAALVILNDIIGGKYTDSTEISGKLDEAANTLEALNLMETYDKELNNAADYLTEVMAKEAV